MARIGFIGVGKMGRGMCHNLINAGHEMVVFDLDPENTGWFEGRAAIAPSALEACRNADIIFLSLPNSETVESVVGELIADGAAGKTVVDASTSDPDSTRKLCARLKSAGANMVDAPLLGGPDDTMAGNAPCIISGDKETADRLIPIISAYASPIDYFGEIGSAHTVKLAMNFTGLMYAALMAQMFPLMEKQGIDIQNLFKVMNEGPFGNWVFNFYGRKYVERDYHMDFSLGLALKDMTYMKRMYEKQNVPAFLLDGGLDLLRAAVKDGRASADYSEIAATMREYLGLEPYKETKAE